MHKDLILIVMIFLFSCTGREKSRLAENSEVSTEEIHNTGHSKIESQECDYLSYYKNKGNQVMDTIRIEKELIDPIDDTLNFEMVKHGFFANKSGSIFKKAKTYEECNGNYVEIEYYQDFSEIIDLETYEEIEESRFFKSKNRLFFWWGNSGGHMAIQIEHVDLETFKPSKSFCGGYDKKGVLYGSPNWGVYRLNIPDIKDYELIAKENNYWNTPQHYLISNGEIYDVKFDSQRDRYYCDLTDAITMEEILILKENNSLRH